jgi:predicted DNA-binding protein (UPF0251 family)
LNILKLRNIHALFERFLLEKAHRMGVHKSAFWRFFRAADLLISGRLLWLLGGAARPVASGLYSQASACGLPQRLTLVDVPL